MDVYINPKEIVKEPPYEQHYQDDVIRHCFSEFNKKGIFLERLTYWQQHINIIYPWNENYDIERTGYNRYHQVYPLAIIMALKKSEIQWALKKARELKVNFTIKAGGHCHAGSSLCDGFIINVSKRKYVRAYDNYLEIGAGACLGHIEKVLSEIGGVCPYGTCMNVGACGLALGLGVGLYIRKYGATLDNILSVSIILADGTHVVANKNEYSDLFWAMRGAGASNFGIVTDLRFRYYKLKQVLLYKMKFAASKFKKLLSLWQVFAPYATNDLASKMCINPLNDKTCTYPITIKGQFIGSQEQLTKLIKPFLELSHDYKIWPSSIMEAALWHNESCQNPPWFFYYQTLFAVKPLNETAIDRLYKFIQEAPDETSIIINALGGRFGEIKSHETAFPWRDATLWLHLASETREQKRYPVMKKVIKSLYKDLLDVDLRNERTGVGRLYTNFKDTKLKPHEYMRAYYGNNAEKLIAIKKKYDPTNVFSSLQGIPPKLS